MQRKLKSILSQFLSPIANESRPEYQNVCSLFSPPSSRPHIFSMFCPFASITKWFSLEKVGQNCIRKNPLVPQVLTIFATNSTHGLHQKSERNPIISDISSLLCDSQIFFSLRPFAFNTCLTSAVAFDYRNLYCYQVMLHQV